MDAYDTRNSRVLVFDDNDVDRIAVCLALNESGFAGAIHDTGSASQALEQIKSAKFDCIYIGDSSARTHLFSVVVALNRVGYRGRLVIVSYGLELERVRFRRSAKPYRRASVARPNGQPSINHRDTETPEDIRH